MERPFGRGGADRLERPIVEDSETASTDQRATRVTAPAYRGDRLVVIAGIIVLTALAWGYLIVLSGAMGSVTSDPDSAGGMAMQMAGPNPNTWTGSDFVFMFWMWAVMMVAMMLPSATPTILLVARVNRQRQAQQRPYAPVAVFAVGYVIVWSAFSIAATLANWGLHRAGFMTSMMGATGSLLGGGLLIAAGLFQFTPLKYACLNHCQSPMSWLMRAWRDGWVGAVEMGVRHGLYCLGCCWLLMALLFALGVMNLPWIAALAVFVLLEKVAPGGATMSRLSGLALIGWGVWLSAWGS